MRSSKNKGAAFVVGALIALGTVASAYLLVRQFRGTAPASDVCAAIFGVDCQPALESEMAVQLGLPLAGWGLVHFAMVAAALLLAVSLGEQFRVVGTLAALALCTVAAVIGGLLTGMMLFGTTPLCPLCLAVHAINLALIPAVVLASGRPITELGRSFTAGLRYLVGGHLADPIAIRWKISGLILVLLFGIVVYQWVLIQTERRLTPRGNSVVSLEEVLDEFRAGQEFDLPTLADDPLLGEQNAPLRLVIFSDFECPACKRFAQIVKQAREAHSEVSIVFKHYPLSAPCNPAVSFDMHPHACRAAWAAEAARRQGKFWEYHDALFGESTGKLDEQALTEIAVRVGLNAAQFESDFAADATRAKVAADVALGETCRVIGTPTVFVNNKRVPSDGIWSLNALLERVAADAAVPVRTGL